MYHEIEIIGMRKNRDLKIVITIIVLAIIGIIASIGVIFYEKHKTVEVSAQNGNIITEEVAMSENNSTNLTEDSGKTLDENAEIIENTEMNTSVTSKEEANKDKNSTEQSDEEKQQFVKSINNIYNGKEGKRVFLTFDDGPTTQVTPHILDILDKYNIKATFFVLGTRVKQNPDILKREYESGHYIANHGYSHKYSKIYENVDTVFEEYNKTEEAIRVALEDDSYSSNLFRFPGGSRGGPYEKVKKEARKKLNEKGIAYLDWSALTYDAEGAKTKDAILKNLKETINGWNNVVVLMHDSADKQVTYETLEDVIKYLQNEGYKFRSIYDLI